ncbi:PQQ-binding-like beta-propeller repeat protein [uncultured Proteiniphilum sp.]|nr:PQQ-binding-like beta-propeller repeat protein [uncultured Proteiniphilum sp.]
MYALERETGLLLWKHALGAPILGTVAISGNTLFTVDFSGNVYGYVSTR